MVNTLRDGGASGKTIQNKMGFCRVASTLRSARASWRPTRPPASDYPAPCAAKCASSPATSTSYYAPISPHAGIRCWTSWLLAVAASRKPPHSPGQRRPHHGNLSHQQGVEACPDGSYARYELGQPKTKRSNRTIDVPPHILDGLDYTGEWLFTNSHGGPIRLYSWRSNVWNRAVAKAQAVDPDNPGQARAHQSRPAPRPATHRRQLALSRRSSTDRGFATPRPRGHLGHQQDLRTPGPHGGQGGRRRHGAAAQSSWPKR